MKTTLTFIAGLVIGAGLTLLGLVAMVAREDASNHNGYKIGARLRGDLV